MRLKASGSDDKRAAAPKMGVNPRPGLLGDIKSEFLRNVMYPVLAKRWHSSAYRHLRELRELEFAPLDTIETLQWTRIKAVLRYAAHHVPYYRDLLRDRGMRPEDIRSPGDYERVPILTKAILQEKLQDLCTEDRDKSVGQPNASGGSTGKPVQFFQSSDYWDHARASQSFVEGWWGIRPGDRTASFWGADRDIPDQTWRERLYGAITQMRMCNAFAMTANQMERFAQMLMTWQPRHVTGYASALEIFSKFLLDRPALQIRPRAVKATADVLGNERREIIEQAFGCSVYNFYGSREINNLAAECPARCGLHINALSRHIEIVDDAGKAVPPGVPGRILLTDLTNYFMPFLRYEIEDIGSWTGSACSCGRPFPLLSKIWGRSSDFIVTPEGKLIHSIFFTHLFYDMPDVALFQINQKDLHNIGVYLVLRPGIREYPAPLLRERLRQALGPDIAFSLEVVPEIKRPPSGKHRFVVSSVRPSWGTTDHSVPELRGVRVP